MAFRNSALERLSERYEEQHKKYQSEQREYVEQIIEIAGKNILTFSHEVFCSNITFMFCFKAGYSPCFEQLGNLMSLLDVLTNFAIVAANSPTPFIRPVLHPKGTGIMKLEGLRHPCVEVQPNVNFISNDISFEKGRNKERLSYCIKCINC